MMEVFSLHREMTGEEGEQCRVRYSLTEDSCGPERCYGILCCVEGSRRPGRCCRLPGLLENRGVGELLVEYLARREVTPVQLEDILVELLQRRRSLPRGRGRRPPGRSPGRAPRRGAHDAEHRGLRPQPGPCRKCFSII